MKLPRRRFLHLAAGAAALPTLSRTARAQAYPSRPVTMIVPFAAGAGTDAAARVIGEYMSRMLGQPFIIENVPGAGGTTGSTRVMRARPDGHTILMGHVGTHAFAVPLFPNLAYKPDVDFEPIGTVFEQPFFIVAKKDFPPNDLREFISYAKANAEKLNVSHAGVGSTTFTYVLLLNSLLKVKPTMVPFNGAAPAMNALVAGQCDYMCNGITSIGQHVQAGIIKAYAIGAPERHPVCHGGRCLRQRAYPNLFSTDCLRQSQAVGSYLQTCWRGWQGPQSLRRIFCSRLPSTWPAAPTSNAPAGTSPCVT